MDEAKLGRQTPTTSVIVPYTHSHGEEAVELYNKSGRTALEWQRLLVEDIMAVDNDELWVHMKFGYGVPRRNGKSEVIAMRMLYAITHGERALYTAHRTTTSHSMWEKTVERLTKIGYTEKDDFKSTKQFGLERIEMLDGSEAVINFRTRSSKGGLGEGYDLLVIDEAQEYTTDQETALKYIVTDSKNPQTIMCGTPPTAVSAGTVFVKLRQLVLSGESEDAGWAEWSVPKLSDAHNPDLWYETNPSLGSILTERKIRSELGKNEESQLDDNIQRLGYWVSYNQKSAISRNEWRDCIISSPKLSENHALFFGVKYSKSTSNVSLAVAVRLADEKIFVEAIDCQPIRNNNAWIIGFLRNCHADTVIIDGAGGQTILKSDIEQAECKCEIILPKVSEIIEANALFESNLFGNIIRHADQPALEQAISNCEHRAIGSGGGFGYNSVLEGADISLLDAVALAHWGCTNYKGKKKQIIQY